MEGILSASTVEKRSTLCFIYIYSIEVVSHAILSARQRSASVSRDASWGEMSGLYGRPGER